MELRGEIANAPAGEAQVKNSKPSPSLVTNFASRFDSAMPYNMSRHEWIVGAIGAALGHYFARSYVDKYIGRTISFATGQWTRVASAVVFGWLFALASRYTSWDERILNTVYSYGNPAASLAK
jgi:hypothetical protein